MLEMSQALNIQKDARLITIKRQVFDREMMKLEESVQARQAVVRKVQMIALRFSQAQNQLSNIVLIYLVINLSYLHV